MAIGANAQQKVVLQSGANMQQFIGINAFKDAYNAAAAEDVIYLPGATYTAPELVDKKLTIYGCGHYPDSTLATGSTRINGNLNLGENADNLHIEGVEIIGDVNFAVNKTIDGVVITRCKLNYLNINGNLTAPSNNLAVIGSVLAGGISFQNLQSGLVSNSIIQGRCGNISNITFNNNVFLNSGSSYVLVYAYNNIISNCVFVFVNNNGFVDYCSGNTYRHNIFTVSTPGLGVGATDIGNYKGVPQANIFVDQTDYAFSYLHNYHLKTPATHVGTDGTQVGIYGGAFPYKEGAVPINPHIQKITVAPQTDAAGKLDVKIKVKAQ